MDAEVAGHVGAGYGERSETRATRPNGYLPRPGRTSALVDGLRWERPVGRQVAGTGLLKDAHMRIDETIWSGRDRPAYPLKVGTGVRVPWGHQLSPTADLRAAPASPPGGEATVSG